MPGFKRFEVTLGCSLALLTVMTPTQAAQDLTRTLENLRSTSPFERQRSELELRRLGEDVLVRLSRELQDEDRLYRFRVERIFSERLDSFLDQLDGEYRALKLDEHELRLLRKTKDDAENFAAYRKELEALREEDPDVEDKLRPILELENLEEAARERGEESLTAEDRVRLTELRQRRQAADAGPGGQGVEQFLKKTARLRELARGLGPLAGARGFSDLEAMRVSELETRVAERVPRVEAFERQLEAIGVAGYNRIRTRVFSAHETLVDLYERLVTHGLEKFAEDLDHEDISEEQFEVVRYTQGLLWAYQADQEERQEPEEESRKEQATSSESVQVKSQRTESQRLKTAQLVKRHLEAVLRDVHSPETIIQERAATELFLLGSRGAEALRARIAEAGETPRGRERFLLNLLRWRIRPEIYAQFGTDFKDYPALPFRGRRQKVFGYARVARERAIPTLRAIVLDDSLEKSFFVKLAAAKALAGLGDLTGYSALVIRHPNMTLKRPEVSRELLIVQAYEFIQAKQYRQAVELLREVLEEAPFDFRANYHIAFAYLLSKDNARAVHHFEIARRIHPDDQLTLYNLACAYALLGGKVEEALEALAASAEAGFTDYEHMDKDPDLETLRGEDRYHEILQRMRAKAQ